MTAQGGNGEAAQGAAAATDGAEGRAGDQAADTAVGADAAPAVGAAPADGKNAAPADGAAVKVKLSDPLKSPPGVSNLQALLPVLEIGIFTAHGARDVGPNRRQGAQGEDR